MKQFPWQTLTDWYESHGRHDYPWRQYEGHTLSTLLYRVWLAEILLQQTQADRVVGYYTRMLDRYPSIQDLASTTYEEFFGYYQGLGYYSRARNLLRTAEIVSRDYEGIFPRDHQSLIGLPGIGDYTASAILAFGYGESVLAWDTNLETFFARYYHGRRDERLSHDERSALTTDLESYIDTSPIQDKKHIIRSINNGLMDWMRTMEPRIGDDITPENSIFGESRYIISHGTLEPIVKKISRSFPTPDATIIAIPHQDHRVYYSSDSSIYTPYMLPPALSRDIRKSVQLYFQERYSCEVSVRPAHRKWIDANGIPYVAVHVQIQTGERAQFVLYSPGDAKKILTQLYGT